MHEVIFYLWNGLFGILVFGIVILCIIGGNSSQPTFMSCQERRARFGTPPKKMQRCSCPGCERERRSFGGYQPCAKKCTDNIALPPKNR